MFSNYNSMPVQTGKERKREPERERERERGRQTGKGKREKGSLAHLSADMLI